MSERTDIPLGARALILAAVAGGIAVLAVRAGDVPRWNGSDTVAWAALTVAIAVIEQFRLTVRHGTERQVYSLADALFISGLLTARPSVLVFAVAAGLVVGQVIQRVAPHKLLFNTGQFVIGVTVAQVVYGLLPAHPASDPRAWLAATIGMAAYFVVNTVAVTEVIALVGRRSFAGVLAPSVGMDLMNWAGDVATGILGAVVWRTHPAGIPLVAAPMAMSYFAHRAWLAEVRARHRTRQLYEAGRALMGPLEDADFAPFLRAVEQLLDAPIAELVMADGLSGERLARPLPEAEIGVRPGLVAATASIEGRGRTSGALVAYRETPLSPPERDLLETLAGQVSVRLENMRLFTDELEQRTRLDRIISHTSDGIFVVSTSGRILTWNPGMERITGYRAHEAIGSRLEERLPTKPRDGTQWPLPAESMAGVAHELPVIRKDGTERWIRYAANPLPEAEGGDGGLVVVARDVTAEVETEELKADFVATVSHELRTPLTPLKGFLMSMIQGTVDDTPEARQEYYRIMLSQAERLERLITDLLEVSRIESGMALADPRVIDLARVLAGQVEAVALQHPARAVRFDGPRMPILVRADPFRVEQVLTNLVSNAVKYSPADSSIEISVVERGDHAIVSVADLGEGIPAAEAERVFDRFHRVDNGLTRRKGGAGLGLYIARQFVHAMSGRIWVTSERGQGATFSFTLPLVREAVGDTGPPASDPDTDLARSL